MLRGGWKSVPSRLGPRLRLAPSDGSRLQRGLPSRKQGVSQAVSANSQSGSLVPRKAINTLGSSVSFHSGHGLVNRHTVLQSAFPKKTAIFFAILFAGIYWVAEFVEIDETPHWAVRVRSVFDANEAVAPLAFADDIEQLSHWVNDHIPEVDGDVRDPNIQHLLLETDYFSTMCNGWVIGGRGLSGLNRMRLEKDVDGGYAVRVYDWEHEDRLKGDWRTLGFEERKESGLCETHGCRFTSNDPCEDYFGIGTSPGPGNRLWNYWGIYDGHAGAATSKWLQFYLIPYVSMNLSALSAESPSNVILDNIKKTFVGLDKSMLDRALYSANWHPAGSAIAIANLSPAVSGSCALLSMFDSSSSTLRVACVGDSRAVLGRWNPSTQSYTAIALSEDQTGFNPSEVSRITDAHPDEPGIIDPSSGRLLGLAVTRAFGDSRWKWANDIVSSVATKFWGPSPRPNSKTPPYMDAEPVITTTEIVRPHPDSVSEKPDFLIMASDGLWDRISTENAVELVSRWRAQREAGKGRVGPVLSGDFPPRLIPKVSEPSFSQEEIDAEGGLTWQATPETFAIRDENAAVCLQRNAMGGTRAGLVMGLWVLAGPWKRNAVDDTTIMVVFFDKEVQDQGSAEKNGKGGDNNGGGGGNGGLGLGKIDVSKGLGVLGIGGGGQDGQKKRWWRFWE